MMGISTGMLAIVLVLLIVAGLFIFNRSRKILRTRLVNASPTSINLISLILAFLLAPIALASIVFIFVLFLA